MPNQPQDPLAQSGNDYGPFSDALLGPLTPQNQAPPLSGAPSKGGAIALYLGKFLQGAQVAQRQNYERSEAAKRESEGAMMRYAQAKMADPNLSPEGKQALTTALNTALAQQSQEILKGADKGQKGKDPHPLLALTQKITNAVLGPGENKKHKDFGSLTAQLMTIGEDPKYRIDPNAISADSISSSPQQGATQPAQRPAPPQQAQQQPTAGQGYLANQYPAGQQATPPPPGTTPAAAQAPVKTYASKAEMWADPEVQQSIQDITRKGQDWNKTLLGQKYAALPDAKEVAPKGITAVIYGEDGKIQKYVNAVRTPSGDLVDPSTNKTIPGAVEATPGLASNVKAVNPTLTTTQQNRQTLIDAYVLNGMSKSDAEKKVAELDTKSAENKAAPKPTKESALAQDITDSGGATSPDDAKKKAATILSDQEKKKATPPASRIPPPTAVLSPSSPGGKALIDKAADNPGFDADAWAYGLTGKTPFTGGSKETNEARQKLINRWYQISSTLGLQPSDIEALRGEVTADKSALSKMTWLNASVTQFEDTLQRNMALAEQLNAKYDRTGIKFSNRIQNWYRGEKNDKNVNNFMSQLNVMAPEYAKIMSGSTSVTGATVSGAADAHQVFDKALSQGGFQSLLDNVVKPDLANRKGALDASKNQLLDKLRGKTAVNNVSGGAGGNVASRFSQADQSAHAEDIKQIDTSKDAVKVKGYGKDDKLPNGMTVRGITKDGHVVAW